jgi:cation transporter-like permease
MKRTSPLVLILLAVAGGGIGYLVDHLLTIGGRATFSPSPLLPVLLLLLAAAVLALAWPVRRSARGRSRTRIDPFRAMRAATLARASSLLGALLAGFGAGLLVFLLSRPVGPQVGSIVAMTVAVASSLVLVVAALVAEQFCTLPKDPDDRQPDDPTGADRS